MLKILVWNFAKDKGYLDDALKILERQHNGIEIVGVTADTETSLVYDGKNIPFVPLDEVGRMGGGIMTSSSSSAQNIPVQTEQI